MFFCDAWASTLYPGRNRRRKERRKEGGKEGRKEGGKEARAMVIHILIIFTRPTSTIIRSSIYLSATVTRTSITLEHYCTVICVLRSTSDEIY